jgi:hypothetical protein
MLTPIFKGYTFKESNAVYDELAHVSKNLEITYTYSNGETSIEEVKSESGKMKTIYDLQGRKVENPSKGIYIIDGKKVFLK